jgi:hypothetical protein
MNASIDMVRRRKDARSGAAEGRREIETAGTEHARRAPLTDTGFACWYRTDGTLWSKL